MKINYVIFCQYCGKNTTIGVEPSKKKFEKMVNCSVCNKEIDANNGGRRVTTIKYKNKSVDLLRVN